MFFIYVGDSKKNVINRILTNHCSGNVEGSGLREAVAQKMGIVIARIKRPSGNYKIRINLPIPKEGEDKISEYIRSGTWRYIICRSYDEAHDFQWFLIDQLEPILNKVRKPWKKENTKRYICLLNLLEISPILNYRQLRGRHSGPGTYVLYHEEIPHNP